MLVYDDWCTTELDDTHKKNLTYGNCRACTEKMIRQQAAQFLLIDQDLYRREYIWPLLKCITPYQDDYAMWEIHKGVCGTHSRARTMATKVLRADYYWSTELGVPKLISPKVKEPSLYSFLMAIFEMGNGYHRTLYPRKGAKQISSDGNRLFYQVDRGC